MAGNNLAQIHGGFIPYVYLGPPNATLPIDPVTAPGTGFVNFGLVTDDGITFGRSLDTQKVRAMGITNQYVYQRITARESTVAMTFMQSSSEVLAVYNQQTTTAFANTAAGGGLPQYITITDTPNTTFTQYSMVLDLVDSASVNPVINRKCYPVVQVSDTGDLTYSTTGAPLGYPITFDVLEGSTGTLPYEMWSNVTKSPFPSS